MTKRTECQIHYQADFDMSRIEPYRSNNPSGIRFSYMTLAMTAYLRTVSQYPEINRFNANRRVYARRDFFASFIMLRTSDDGQVQEAAVKVRLDLEDTILDVHQKLEQAINENRDGSANNNTDKTISKIMGLPFIAKMSIKIIKWLDAHGKLPRGFVDASPYHSSLFVSNLASINLDNAFHHLVEFGTNSVFMTIGRSTDKVIRLGMVIDSRICGGYVWAKAHKAFCRYLKNPDLLEQKPEKVVHDIE